MAIVLQQACSIALVVLASAALAAQTKPDFSGPTVHVGVKWEGESLVFESGSHTGQLLEHGVWSERREVWTIDPDGRLRVVISTRDSAHDPTAVTRVYRRR